MALPMLALMLGLAPKGGHDVLVPSQPQPQQQLAFMTNNRTATTDAWASEQAGMEAEEAENQEAQQAVSSVADGLTAFVIAEDERFTSDRIDTLKRLGFQNVEQVQPVNTELTCVDNDRGSTGCYFAHRKAWRRVAALGQRAVVLESDWSIGSQNESVVAETIAASITRSEDWVSLGYCGLPPDGSGCPDGVCGGESYPHSTRPLQCMTSYIINPEVVHSLLPYNVCSIPENAHTSPNADWFLDHLCEAGTISCFFAAGPPPMEGMYGQGVFQQDESYGGVHAEEHNGQTDELGGPKNGERKSSLWSLTGKVHVVKRSKYDKEKVSGWFAAQARVVREAVERALSSMRHRKGKLSDVKH